MYEVSVDEVLSNLNVGDVVVGKLRCGMILYSFFEVKGKTKCSVKLQKLGTRKIGGPQYAYTIEPKVGVYEGSPFTRKVSKWGGCYENGHSSTYITLTKKYNPEHEYNNNFMD